MLRSMRDIFTENIGLKVLSLILAVLLWFYIVGELNKGSDEERQFLKRVLPSGGVTAKKFVINPIFIGSLRKGFSYDPAKVIVIPEYCIVVGTKDVLGNIKYAYTMPIDLEGATKSFTKSVPLTAIAPGIYMEETLVQVTVPIEKLP